MGSVVSSPELEILSAVDSFYRGAFDTLLHLTIAIIGLAAVFVPLLISFIQSRSLRKENEALKTELAAFINEEIDKRLASSEEKIRAFLDLQLVDHRSAISATEAALDKKNAIARGGVFYVQAAHFRDKNLNLAAITSFMDAASCMIDGGDFINLRKPLEQIIELFPLIDKRGVVEAGFDKQFQQFIEKLSTFSDAAHYQDCIDRVTEGVAAAKERDPKTADG